MICLQVYSYCILYLQELTCRLPDSVSNEWNETRLDMINDFRYNKINIWLNSNTWKKSYLQTSRFIETSTSPSPWNKHTYKKEPRDCNTFLASFAKVKWMVFVTNTYSVLNTIYECVVYIFCVILKPSEAAEELKNKGKKERKLSKIIVTMEWIPDEGMYDILIKVRSWSKQ